jgi:predicted aspartyl protease
MKKVSRIGALAIFLSFVSILAIAQSGKKSKTDTRYGFHLKGKKQSFTKVPFEFHANLIVVKVLIDESDTLRFILDTGVSSTIITDARVANSMNIKYTRRVKISGAGEGEPLMANVSIGHSLRMGDVMADKQNIVVLDQDVLKLSEFMGLPIHGIFGFDLFNSFVVSIDFENRNLFFSEPDKFKFKKSMGVKYPMVVTQSKPYTDAIALVSNDQKSVPVRLVIDTGAGHALLLNTDKNHEVNLPDKVIRANLGRGLNGEINGHIGRVNKIRFGSVEMKNILASFPDSLSFSMKFPTDIERRQGSIGCELLRRFVVTLNYADGYLALRPIKSRMKEAFEHDMSGMEVRAKGDKFNTYFIERIIPDSPAEEAGLEVNDEIIFMDSQNVKEMTISEIYKMLSKREGKTIDMFIRRKGNLTLTTLKLRRII